MPSDFSRVSISLTTTKMREVLPRLSTCEQYSRRALLVRNCVYKYTCPCGQLYIGETSRRLAVRVDEHSSSGAIFEHVKEAADSVCTFDKANFSIVARNLRGTNSRKRCEALYIKFYERRAQTVNAQSYSRELIIF